MRGLRLPKRLLPVIILAIAGGFFALLLSSRPEPALTQDQERSWTVKAETLSTTRVQAQLQLLGRVESPFHSQLTASITADVQKTRVLEGDEVAKGDILVELDDQEAQLVYRQRQADVDELTALIEAEKRRQQTEEESLVTEEKLLELNERSIKRLQQLATQDLAAESIIDTADQELQRQQLALNLRRFTVDEHPIRIRQLEARLARANAMLTRAALDLSRTRIKAPFNGQVTALHVSPGDRLRPGDPVLEVYDTEHKEIRAQLPERWLGDIRSNLINGHQLTAEGELFGQPFTLELDRIAGRANPGSGGADALFTVTSGAEHLLIEKTVDITLHLPGRDDRLTAPLSAMYGQRIYLIEDNRLRGQEVNIQGQYFTDGGEQRVIISHPDLKPGAIILTTQLPRAITGLKVTLQQPAS